MSKRSPVWLYFSVVDNYKKIAKCDVCKQKLSFKYSVSNLKKHFTGKHPTIKIGFNTQNANSNVRDDCVNNSDSNNPDDEKELGRSETVSVSESKTKTCSTIDLGPSISSKSKPVNKQIQGTISSYVTQKKCLQI